MSKLVRPITLLGFDYRPQLADLHDARLWRILIGADYGPLNAAARGKIDLGRVERQWSDIVRVVASIHTGAVPAYDILRVSRPAARRPSSVTRSRTTAGYPRRCTSCPASTTSPTTARSRACATSKKAATTWRQVERLPEE